uniref:Uncharacterized protein n=1 Tax=Romanomermis culicivorax TaxID=13658 RepID=A0A915KQS3_ROMCU
MFAPLVVQFFDLYINFAWQLASNRVPNIPRASKLTYRSRLPVCQSVLAQTPVMVIGNNKYQGLYQNGWQVTPILTSALLERPSVLRSMMLPGRFRDKTQKERDQMIITQFYSKSLPVIQATMDKHKGQVVSLQDLVMFCDNLEKELKIQDELFEQRLIPSINSKKTFLSTTERNLEYFHQLTLSEKYVLGKENAFADFLSRKYDVDQPGTNNRSTSNTPKTTDAVNVVKTRSKSRQKLAPLPQNDLEVLETPDEEKIVDLSQLPNQDQWPFTQQQISDALKVDPTLNQTQQKVENQYLLFQNLTTIHKEVLKELPKEASEAGSKRRFDEKVGTCEYTHYSLLFLVSHHLPFCVHKMSTLFEQMSTKNGLPASFILTVILNPPLIAWFQQFTRLFEQLTTWSRKLSTCYKSPNFAEIKVKQSAEGDNITIDQC